MDNMFLDRREDISIKTGGNLPHWHQAEKVQFVTFRLADSLPQTRIQEIKYQIELFRSAHPEPWDEQTKQQYWRMVGPMEERLLHNGYGSCLLRNRNVREILIRCLEYGNGSKYRLFAYVIMPNHVHILMQPFEDNNIHSLLQSIKSFSARKINEFTGHIGQVWMRESFDRIVRNEDTLKFYIAYIRSNPKKLSSDSYTLKLL